MSEPLASEEDGVVIPPHILRSTRSVVRRGSVSSSLRAAHPLSLVEKQFATRIVYGYAIEAGLELIDFANRRD